MALSRRDPNTIAIRPSQLPANRIDCTLPATEAITPGMLVEHHNDGTALEWGVHDSANEPCAASVALDQIELNKGIDDAYAIGDLVKVGYFLRGERFWGLIPSGQNITQGAKLQSNGDGKLKAYAAGPGGFVAVSSPGSVTADTRVWVEVL
jgi:hypothetical protein